MYCVYCNVETKEYLTRHEDGLVKPYRACPKCMGFYDWVKIEKSILVQQILQQNLEQYKREKN